MRRAYLLFLFLLCSLPCLSQVVRLTVNDTIQPISAEYIERGIDHAAGIHAQAVLIDLRTPGGLLSSTRDIISKILNSPVPVIVYVSPTGANAASAGFFILQSADVAAMAPGTNTGSAHPIMKGLGLGTQDEIMKMKVENDLAAFLRSYVEKRGRNVALAETAVRESKAFSDQEALNQKLVEFVATDERELLSKIDGKSIRRFDGTTAILKTAGQPIADYDRTLRQRIMGFLVDPNIAFLVLAIGVISLYFEFNHPGAIVPGVVGVIFILLAIFALNLLPVRIAAVTLILASFAFFALEAKYTSHGALGIGGVVLLTLGGLLLVDGPVPEMRVRLITALSVAIPFGIISIFLMTIALRARRNKVTTGAQGMIGQTAVAQSAINPHGKVMILGELWNAYSSVPVATAEAVVVRNVDGLTLFVEPIADQKPQSDPVLQR